MASNINELKRQVFYEMLDLAGRVYVHIRYTDDVVIGDRGFLPEEKEKGIILVLNSKMKFHWNDDGISADLVFGSTVQKCFVPAEDIVSIVSPELNAQFSVVPDEKEKKEDKTVASKKKQPHKGEKVIRVDFHRKK
jgi:hypothetical protein